MQSSPPSSPPAASMDPARQQVHEGWRNTLARVVPAVVVLKVVRTDTIWRWEWVLGSFFLGGDMCTLYQAFCLHKVRIG